jgi:multiple sugar transport system substrate-binding protein
MRGKLAVGAALLATAVVAGGTGTASARNEAAARVDLQFWSWVPNIDRAVALWNRTHPQVHVTVSKQAQGDAMVAKVLTSVRAKNGPDLAQVLYQNLPTLVASKGVLDIGSAGAVKGRFASGVWNLVTLGTDRVWAIPQDTAPMMLFYRRDVFQRYGLEVPATWTDFAAVAKTLKQKDGKAFLTNFSAADPGWFAGLAGQAGANWWSASGDTWQVSINDAQTRRVASFWGNLVNQGLVDGGPDWTPQWNKALGNGTMVAWLGAAWSPAVLEGIAPKTRGKWAMAPLPAWRQGDRTTGFWGGSTTAVVSGTKHQKEAEQFAIWLNTDPRALQILIDQGGVYPAETAAQTGGALARPPHFLPNQPAFYPQASQIGRHARGFQWGPAASATFTSFLDALSKAITRKGDFAAALDSVQSATVSAMKTAGFKVQAR